jgi:hypothetical protein
VTRLTQSARLELQNVAEREIQRYAGDHALWHKHVHNVELDPVQILKMKEMDQFPYSVDFSSRRTGKTAVKEMYFLEWNACHSDQELGIVAPREAQSLVNLGYHLDAIRRSQILDAWIGHRSGRRTIADTYYSFANRSKAAAYGIMAQVDGGDLTAASLEEVDDMPKERLFSRFLLMLGATRRLGAAKDSHNKPQIRITGVYKGADTLTDLLKGDHYHALGCFHGEAARNELRRLVEIGEIDPTDDGLDIDSYTYPVPIANAINGQALGLLNGAFIADMKGQLPRAEYIRQLLCINTSSRNVIWEIFVRQALQTGLASSLQIAGPLPGERYKRRGMIAFGYDAGGHGEDPTASKHALVVAELIGNFVTFPYVRQWSAGEDDQVVKRDIIGIWDYFRPDVAFGDAYGVGMITQACDELYALGLTHIDRRSIGDGQSTASTWPEWPFAPVRFEGMVKHSMYSVLRSVFHNRQAAIPYVEDIESADPETADLQAFVRQLPNVVSEPTKASYPRYKQADRKVGDDLADAAGAAVWGLINRGIELAPGVVLMQKKTRDQLIAAG